MAIIGYIFLSPEKTDRMSLEDQRRAIMAYCREMNHQVMEIYVEQAVSIRQALINRAEGRKMIERARRGDTLVVARVAYVLGSSREASRLLADLRLNKVSMYCLDLAEDITCDRERRLAVSDGGAVLIQKLLAALSLCDSSSHGEAIREAKRERRQAGRYLGGPVPFGWLVDGKGRLVQYSEQQRVIREMKQMREDRWSYRAISGKLQERYGLSLSHEGIRRILATDQCKREEEKQRIAAAAGNCGSAGATAYSAGLPGDPEE
jgi:DNA invertase Pin-like site-specific DNA recombinase